MSSSGGEVSQFWFISFNFPLLNTLHRRPLDASNALKNHQLISILYGVRVPGVEWSMPFARWVDFSFISSNLHKHSLGACFYLLDIYLLNLSLLYFPLLTFVWLTKEYLSNESIPRSCRSSEVFVSHSLLHLEIVVWDRMSDKGFGKQSDTAYL